MADGVGAKATGKAQTGGKGGPPAPNPAPAGPVAPTPVPVATEGGKGGGAPPAARGGGKGSSLPIPKWTDDMPTRGFFPLRLAEELEAVNRKGMSEHDSFDVIDKVWGILDKEGMLKPGSRGHLLPLGGAKEVRYNLRLALICGLALDAIDDLYTERESTPW